MNLLCPACHTPLPAADAGVVTCTTCAAEVDLARASTAAGKPRFVPEVDRSGSEIGGHRLKERLGAGGMGTVYRAEDAQGQARAVKVLSPALAAEPALVARFLREVQLLAALDHPGIVRVNAHGEHEGVPWFAMELVVGKDLRARLAAGPLPPAETARLFEPLLEALQHAHGRGITHRDLKPANVLLAAEGPKLADFGIAQLETGAGAAVTRLTETAAVLGTLPYMSPEQRAGGAVDQRSDLFSVGVMLYEAATGVLPQGAFTPASQLNEAYGKRFDEVVARLLRPLPAARYASATDARVALQRALSPRRPLARRLVLGAGATTTAGLAVLLTLGPGGARKSAETTVVKQTPPALVTPTQQAPEEINQHAPAPAPSQLNQQNAAPQLLQVSKTQKAPALPKGFRKGDSAQKPRSKQAFDAKKLLPAKDFPGPELK